MELPLLLLSIVTVTVVVAIVRSAGLIFKDNSNKENTDKTEVIIVKDLVTGEEIGTLEKKRVFDIDYSYRKAKIYDLDFIYRMAVKAFGSESVSSLDVMKRWHEIDRSMFHLVIKEQTSIERGVSNTKIVGYYSIMKITNEALNKLLHSGGTGASLLSTDINPKSRIIYIGAVVGDKRTTQGIIMSNLQTYLQNQIDARSVDSLWARPVTDDGLRLIKKFNFIKHNGNNDLYYIDLNTI